MSTAAAVTAHTVQSHRLNGLSFLLTYSGLTPTGILPPRMLAAVEVWAGRKAIMEWLGAIEIHENPARESHNHHWHMYIRFTSRLDISDRRRYGRFDITLADNTVAHPDIRLVNQGATDRMRTLTYVAKQQGGENPKVYGRMFEPIPCFAQMYRTNAEGDAQADDNNMAAAEIPRAVSWGDAMNRCATLAACEIVLRLDYSNIYYMHWQQIKKNLSPRFRLPFDHRHSLAEFTTTLRDFDVGDWKRAGPIVVTGPSGIGKTTWVAAHARNPLIVKSIEDARDFEPGVHDLLILDDVNFRQSRSAEWAIALLDFHIERTVDARYSPVRIPRMTPMIFTTNYTMDDPQTSIFPRGENAQQQLAIERRFTTVRVATSLFIT